MHVALVLGLAIFFVVGLSISGIALAQDVARTPDEVSRMTREISQEVLSPYCPGKTLAMCPSGAAGDTRREIQELARGGMDKEAIKDELIARFGEEFRMHEAPPEDNLKLLGALVVGLGLSIGAVAVLVRRRRGDAPRAADDGVDGQSAEDDAYLKELRSEYQD